MTDPTLTWPQLKELIEDSAPLRRQLKEIYARIPSTRCQRRARCCTLLPEMTFLEALEFLAVLGGLSPERRVNLLKKIVSYFFINPTALTSCPFLQGPDCLIYPERFFGCRVYGLWSAEAYAGLTSQTRQQKTRLREQWEKLGVRLPEEVLSFQVPYCTRVEPDQDHLISDRMLEQIGDSLEQLSEGIQPWHRQFRNDYFSDLGFFLAGLLLGRLAAVREKFFIAKEILEAGDGTRLHRVLDRLPDPFRFPGNGSEPRRTL